LIVATGW